MGKPETKVGDLCAEPGITRQTLYRHVDPEGKLGPEAKELLSGQTQAAARTRWVARFWRV